MKSTSLGKENDTNVWSTEWPTEPGHYWFYGFPSALAERTRQKRRLLFVRVRQGSNAMIYTTDARFLHMCDANGVWMKATLPDPPTEGE